MTLLERIAARQCVVVECTQDRAQDAQVCGRHLTDLWMHRLDRNPDGTYSPRRIFIARDETRRAA